MGWQCDILWLQRLGKLVEPLHEHGMIATCLLYVDFVAAILFWKCFARYVIHDVSKLVERKERLSDMDGSLVMPISMYLTHVA